MPQPWEPVAVRPSRWVADPWTRMAYSYLRVGGSPAHRSLLGTAVDDSLFIVGEATATGAPGTMHGAWHEGERAAAALARTCGSVVVVGAGIAGLAAARALTAAGRAVTVYEAANSAGGRARSVAWRHGHALPGAMWLHGDRDHPLAPWVRAAGIPTAVGMWGDDHDPAGNVATFVGGTQLAPDEVERLVALANEFEKRATHASEPLDVALSSVLDPWLESQTPGDRAVLSAWLLGEFEGIFAADARQGSTRWRREPYVAAGDDAMLCGPTSSVFDEMATGLSVQFDTPVRAVIRTNHGWRVRTDASSLDADGVIVTVSLAALDGIEFVPALPEQHCQALEKIGCGREGKVFAAFDHAFWSPLPAFVSAVDGCWLQTFVDVSALVGEPSLCGFAPHRYVDALEKADDETIKLHIARAVEQVWRHRAGA